jgi:hypothetical protein
VNLFGHRRHIIILNNTHKTKRPAKQPNEKS